jgi:hypothetical protein
MYILIVDTELGIIFRTLTLEQVVCEILCLCRVDSKHLFDQIKSKKYLKYKIGKKKRYIEIIDISGA